MIPEPIHGPPDWFMAKPGECTFLGNVDGWDVWLDGDSDYVANDLENRYLVLTSRGREGTYAAKYNLDSDNVINFCKAHHKLNS